MHVNYFRKGTWHFTHVRNSVDLEGAIKSFLASQGMADIVESVKFDLLHRCFEEVRTNSYECMIQRILALIFIGS